MLQAVRVRLRKPTRVFICLARDLALSRNDNCVVRTDRGLEYGTCIIEPDECSDDMAKRYTMSVVRKATYHDETVVRQIVTDERRAAEICGDKIRQRNLPMNLVDVEYTFDRHKVVFYFTADDRVDFRELVRDLAHDLHARIELRHIQVRDKAKIVGGFAACGRELCCATWLSAFMPISMRMAKRQNLSLNPTKISGQCGRLMCCLSYENDMYERPKKCKKADAVHEPEPEGAEGDWAKLLDDEEAPAEEIALADDEDTADIAPGEAVLIVNPDGTEEELDEGEEPEPSDQKAPDQKGQQDQQGGSHRSRRRRKRRKPSSGGGDRTG